MYRVGNVKTQITSTDVDIRSAVQDFPQDKEPRLLDKTPPLFVNIYPDFWRSLLRPSLGYSQINYRVKNPVIGLPEADQFSTHTAI
jgi:hypothetical protein